MRIFHTFMHAPIATDGDTLKITHAFSLGIFPCHTGPGVELLSCDLLREGAPIEPVPPVTHWKPDAVVREAAPSLPLRRAWRLLYCISRIYLFRWLSAARMSVQVSRPVLVLCFHKNEPIHCCTAAGMAQRKSQFSKYQCLKKSCSCDFIFLL